MHLDELRDLIQLVLLEDETPKKVESPREELILSAEDIMFSLTPKSEVSNLHNEKIYTPFRQRKMMPSHTRLERLSKLDPFEVISTVKYGSRDSKIAPLTLKADPDASEIVIEIMADQIFRHFEDEGVVVVSCVDSSHDMAAALAKMVATKFNVPYQSMIKKTMNMNLTWDADEWAAYEDMIRSTEANGNGEPLMIKVKGVKRLVTSSEYLDAVKVVLSNELRYARNLIAAGKKPTMAGGVNVNTGHKRFFNFFDDIIDDDLAIGSKILIVDDNVDSGWTPYHVAKRVRAAGLKPLFAAGFKMMHFVKKKKSAATQAHVATPELDKLITDTGRLADEFAVDLFQIGSMLMAMSDSMKYGVEAAEVFEVMKASPAEVELRDIDTDSIVRLHGDDLTPEQAHHMWATA